MAHYIRVTALDDDPPMRLIRTALALAITTLCITAAAAQPALTTTTPSATQRIESGNRVSENVPAIPPELLEQLNRYQNTRGASVAGWTQEGCLLIGTRFADTAQAHRVCEPMGMREQLTFYPEPVSGLTPMPLTAPQRGFVFGKDRGGDEFSQLHWFDLATREVTRLTDGKRTQNSGALVSRDGRLVAYSSTARNNTDTDVWLLDTSTRTPRALVTAGGNWRAMDFSPDGKRLLVMKYMSASESYPGEVDVATGKLSLFPVEGGKASISDIAYAPDGDGVLYVSDEPIAGRAQEFRTLRMHGPGQGAPQVITGDIPWDVTAMRVAEDGRHVAFVANADGISQLHVRRWPSLQAVSLPTLPVGVIGGLAFAPDGKRLAISLNTATSPSDVHVIDLGARTATRWTQSEVGGLDPARFVAPELVRYPTFDRVDGAARTIPAFVYRPAGAATGKRPVIIQIHGGPEAQAFPTFNANAQYLVNELGAVVIVPNVRGSSGYGRTYLSLDNAEKREDSVKDIGALLDWIATQPDLDASRVGVSGGSYGGYMVLASLTNYPERIKAGIDVVGISHFGTFLQNTESYRRDLRRVEYGDERDPAMRAVFDRISPLNNAAKITAPLFVAQGRNDPRVPYTEAEQIVKAVRGNGQPVWFLMFNDEGHGFAKKPNSDYFGAASVLFWQQHLLGDTE